MTILGLLFVFPDAVNSVEPRQLFKSGAQRRACGPHVARNSQDCSHCWINWIIVNLNHVIKTYMHKIGFKTACQITETNRFLGTVPGDPISGHNYSPRRR